MGPDYGLQEEEGDWRSRILGSGSPSAWALVGKHGASEVWDASSTPW